RRALEEMALVLPADEHVHPRPAVPVLLDGGDHGAAGPRALSPVEPSALLAFLDRQSDARPHQEPAAGDAVRPVDVEHDADRAGCDADLAPVRRASCSTSTGRTASPAA